MGRNWSQAEYEQLRKTGSVPGRSSRAIARAKIRLKLRDKQAFRRPWSAAEIQRLCELYAQGHTARTIARAGLLPFTKDAVQKQLCRLGLANKIAMVRFTPAQREKLKAFLLKHWHGKTPEELTQLWNQQYPWLAIDKKRTVSYLSRMKIKIPYSEVIRMNAQRKREEKILKAVQEDAPSSSAHVLEAIRQSRIKYLAARVAKHRDMWSGMPLTMEELYAIPEHTPEVV